MITGPTNPDDLLALIREWFRLLAAGRWEEASAMLDEPNCYGIRWTPGTHVMLSTTPMGRVVGSGSHIQGPQFTDPDTASGTCTPMWWSSMTGAGTVRITTCP